MFLTPEEHPFSAVHVFSPKESPLWSAGVSLPSAPRRDYYREHNAAIDAQISQLHAAFGLIVPPPASSLRAG